MFGLVREESRYAATALRIGLVLGTLSDAVKGVQPRGRTPFRSLWLSVFRAWVDYDADPVLRTRSHAWGSVVSEVRDQRVEINLSAKSMRYRDEDRDLSPPVPARKNCHRDSILGGCADRYTTDLDISDVDLLAVGFRRIPHVRESVRHLETSRTRLVEPLLFEQRIDLRTCQRHRDQAIAKRLCRERFRVRDISGVDIGSDTAGIHERDNCVAGTGAVSCFKLRIGNDITEGRLPASVSSSVRSAVRRYR